MAQPFLGEIKMFAGNFQIRGWAYCNGQLLAISQNDALFALLGTTYGGDGVNTFALPNLQSRVPIHMGTQAGGPTYVQGQLSGTENVTLVPANLPAHTHAFTASNNSATLPAASGNVPAQTTSYQPYIAAAPNVTMAANSVTNATPAGGNQPHNNVQPYLAINFIIAVEGVFPARN
jgi:microcystin-dependent protein